MLTHPIDYIFFCSYLCSFLVIDDTYLGNLVNLVEEHPDFIGRIYNENIRIGNIGTVYRYSRSYGCGDVYI